MFTASQPDECLWEWLCSAVCTLSLLQPLSRSLMKLPACERAAGTQFELEGVVADYTRAVTRQWLLIAPDANPGMLEMFRDRDRQPLRAMEPWAGEFAGKYLTGAVQVYRVTHDAELRKYPGRIRA